MPDFDPLTCHYCGERFSNPTQRMMHEERWHEDGGSSEKDAMFQAGEPMDLAMRLLKTQFLDENLNNVLYGQQGPVAEPVDEQPPHPASMEEDAELTAQQSELEDLQSQLTIAVINPSKAMAMGIQPHAVQDKVDNLRRTLEEKAIQRMIINRYGHGIHTRPFPKWSSGMVQPQKENEKARADTPDLVRWGEPMDIAFQLLKHPVQTTLPQFARNMGPPVMAMRGMSPDRARHAIAYGLRASPKYPVDNKPMVWSVGGTGPHSQREAKQYGSQLVGIREGAFPAIPHDVGSEGTPIYAHPGNVSPSDLVMLMLKAPVVDTDVPGLRMAYSQTPREHWNAPTYGMDEEVVAAEEGHERGIIGEVPSAKDLHGMTGGIEQMTPNHYFDKVSQLSGYPLPDSAAPYRWKGMRMAHNTTEEHIDDMGRGVKEGQVMGMPSIRMDGGGQEGGHRMEALRQMGHGDTEVPVMSYKGEPMDLAFQLLKHATSPEALAHKVDYDTKYETTPERVKYRSDLKQARRLRHIDGKGGPDMSHTQSGSIVAEDPHSNRARHFKERGTLKPN